MISFEIFRHDVWQAVWSHAKSLFRPSLLPSTLSTIILMFFFMFGIRWIFGTQFLDIFSENRAGGFEDLQRMQEEILGYIENMDLGRLMIGLSGLYLGAALISAIVLHIQLLLSEQSLLGTRLNLIELLGRISGSGTLRILGMMLIMLFAYLGIVTIAGTLSGSAAVGFIALFISALVCIRLSGAIPAAVHGSMSLGESLRFSWKYVTWRRAAYVFTVLVIALIVLFLIMLVLQAVFGFMGAAGAILNIIALLLLNSFVLALTTAMLSAAFFRYADYEIVRDVEDELTVDGNTDPENTN